MENTGSKNPEKLEQSIFIICVKELFALLMRSFSCFVRNTKQQHSAFLNDLSFLFFQEEKSAYFIREYRTLAWKNAGLQKQTNRKQPQQKTT